MAQPVNNVIHVKQEPLENEDPNPDQRPQNKHPTLTSSFRLLDQFCRLCLRQRPDLVPLLSRIRDMSVLEAFHAVTGLEMTLEDTYPLKTCRTCMELLDYAYDIRQNFSESYRILKSFLMSKTQPLISNLSEYQDGLRATSETFAEKELREYRNLKNKKETVGQHKAPAKLIPCESIPQPHEKLIELPVLIKHEPELVVEPEELPYPAFIVAEALTDNFESSAAESGQVEYICEQCGNKFRFKSSLDKHVRGHKALDEDRFTCSKTKNTIAEAMTKNAEPSSTEEILSERRDLKSERETVDQCKADPKLNPCVIIPQPQKEPIELPVQIKHEPELILEPKELAHSANTAAEAITHDDGPSAEKFDKNHGQSGKVEYICEYCGKNYPSRLSLKGHVSAHKALDEGRYPCSSCDKKFTTKFKLMQHKRTHTGEKPYQCNACGKSFAGKKYLGVHVSKFHTKSEHVIDGPVITCQFEGCDFSTTKKRNYYHHKAKHELKFQCTQCPQRFPNGKTLQRHLYVHTGVKAFPCQQCGKSFRHKISLDDHIDAHNNRRQYACEMCGMTFVREQILKQHLLKHSSQLSFECRHCGQKFRYRASRQRHEKTHTEAAVKLIDPVREQRKQLLKEHTTN